MRRTPQRRAVLRALEGNTSHPRADEVLAIARHDVPNISASTVYKVLGELEGLGLVVSFPTPDGTRYDPATEAHAHVVCEDCGGLFDLDGGPASAAARREAEDAGFRVTTTAVEVRGVCPGCAGGSASDR
jgi:Fe2+ or Zn2+ uptake regulation protein